MRYESLLWLRLVLVKNDICPHRNIYYIHRSSRKYSGSLLFAEKEKTKMFNNQKFLTCGVMAEIPSWLTNLMWHMVLTMEAEEKDYLQVFKLTKTPTGQHIVHEQEQPPYRYELDIPCDDAVNAKVFVIDDLTHSTMLLAEEY